MIQNVAPFPKYITWHPHTKKEEYIMKQTSHNILSFQFVRCNKHYTRVALNTVTRALLQTINYVVTYLCYIDDICFWSK